jgi:hypothetical protein
MKKVGILIAAFILTFGALDRLSGQNTIEVHEKPLASQVLAGTVRVGQGGEGAKGVRVEQCTRNWKAVKSSTTTNENGRFEFPGVGEGTYYLRFSAPGLTTTLIKVRICKSAPKEMSVTIPFAT